MARYGNADDTDEDDRRVVRDGDRLYFPMALMDHSSTGESKMTTTTKVTFADAAGTEVSIVTDAAAAKAIETLSAQIAAKDATIAELQSKLPVADAAAQVRNHLFELERRKTAPQTPSEKRAYEVANAWR